jgi:hypothetical protein
MTRLDPFRATMAAWIANRRPVEIAHWRNCMVNARTARDPAWRHAMLNRAAWHRRMVTPRAAA